MIWSVHHEGEGKKEGEKEKEKKKRHPRGLFSFFRLDRAPELLLLFCHANELCA